jgi:hypothetical protein
MENYQNKERMHIRARIADDFMQWIEVRLFKRSDKPDKAMIVSDLVWKEVNVAIIPEPSPIRIDMEMGQSLMDQLWECGLRPTEGTGSAGALAATQKHLEYTQSINHRLMSIFEKQQK